MKAKLDDAITDYMSLRGSQDFSRQTLSNERSVLMRLLDVNGNIWVHLLTERHVTRHFEEAAKTRASRSLQLDFTVLNQFFDWARKTRRLPLDVDPMAGRRRPKTRHKERNRVAVAQFPRLLDVAGKSDPRDRAAIALLLYTLCRDNEVSDLRIGDVYLDTGTLRVRISKSYTEDDMPICAELDAELRTWLTHYSASVTEPLSASDYLIPRRVSVGIIRAGEGGHIEGHRMKYSPHQRVGRLGKMVKEVLIDFGFPVEDHLGKPTMEGAHTLRRSGARALFDRLAASGYDRALRIVQSMLHHSSVSVTETYLGITADQRGRDEIIRGQILYPVDDDNVVRLSV